LVEKGLNLIEKALNLIEKGLNLIEKALILIEKGLNFRELKSRWHGNFSAFDRKRFENRDYWSENLLKILFERFLAGSVQGKVNLPKITWHF
jgi:hypothetical protein